jgi:hypothetical protein
VLQFRRLGIKALPARMIAQRPRTDSSKEIPRTMKRSWPLIALILFLLPAASGCLRSVEMSSDDALEAADHYGNIRIEDRWGMVYLAQSIDENEDGDYLLTMVKVIDDGVIDYQNEHLVKRDDVTSIKYYQNNRWMVVGAVTGTALFMGWLYFKINTSVFD